MKKLRKILLMLIAFILLSVTAITASAAKIGDPYTWAGVQIGWIFVIAAVIIGLILWYALTTALFKKSLVPLAIIVAAGLVLALTDVAVEPPITEITPDVTWEVTAVSGSAGMTIDNDARTITKVIGAHPTLEVINRTGDAAWVAGTDDPVINFTITPSLLVGISETTNQATTNCFVLLPDQDFTEDATEYDLFEDVAAGGDKNLAWYTDGTTAYEDKLCTVTIGGSETARLTIHLLDDGLSQREVGESHALTIGVGGVIYTMTVIITETNDMDS